MSKSNLLFIIMVFVSVLFSCTNATNEKTESKTIQSDDSKKTIDNIQISINLVHPDKLPIGEPMRYLMQENGDEIIISPHSRNYNGFMSGERYDIPCVVSDCIPYEAVEYLTFDAILNNESNNDVSIDELYLDVESSKEDLSPYLYIATTEDESNSLIIVDDGWSDYGEMILEYKLLKKNEKFDGSYDFRRIIKRPKDYVILNLTEDLIKLGYNWDFIKQRDSIDEEIPYAVSAISTNSSIDPNTVYYPFEWVEKDNWAYVGFCRIFGYISFTNSKHTVKFKGKLSLSTTGGFGAGFDYDDSFTTELNHNGTNYQVPLPYITKIMANDAERVKVVIKCNKTSNHNFKVCVKDVNGNISTSKNIRVHYAMPRHCDKLAGD